MLARMQAQELLQHDRAGMVLAHDFFPQTHAKENLLENSTHFLNTPSTKTFPKVLHVKICIRELLSCFNATSCLYGSTNDCDEIYKVVLYALLAPSCCHCWLSNVACLVDNDCVPHSWASGFP